MKGKMKAQVFYQPNEMKLIEVDIPQIKSDEVLLKVKACGICGSDVAYYYGRSPLETSDGKGPLILGHEFSGEIVEMGEMAEEYCSFSIGDAVMCNPVRECGVCSHCQETYVTLCNNKKVKGVSVDGAFAEYVTMPYTHIFKIPPGIPYPEAALCEPLACACNGVATLDIRLGDFVVIFGPGSIGLMQMQMIKARGAGTIVMVGIFDFGLKEALNLGANYVFNTTDKKSPYYCDDLTTEISKLSNGEMANRVIVPTSAKQALQGALRVSGKKSNVVYFGLPSENEVLEVPLLDTMTKDKSILVSWQAPFTWVTAQKALRNSIVKIETLISHKFSLEDLEKGLSLMNDPSKPDKIKSVVVFE